MIAGTATNLSARFSSEKESCSDTHEQGPARVLSDWILSFGQADNGAQFVRFAVDVSGRQTRDGHVELEKLSNFRQRESQLLRPFDELQSLEI